jgi:hypothetical protein
MKMSTENVEVAVATVATPAVAVVRNTPSAPTFVKLYNESSTRKDAVARFIAAGYTMTYTNLVARANKLIDKGVALKELERGKRTIDVDALNAQIAADSAAANVAAEPEAPAAE